MKQIPATPAPSGPSTPSQSEMRVLSDGRILVHNLTPAVAALLSELNPSDVLMRQRAGEMVKTPDRLESKSPPDQESPFSDCHS